MATSIQPTPINNNQQIKHNRACRCLNVRLRVEDPDQQRDQSSSDSRTQTGFQIQSEKNQLRQVKLDGDSAISVLLPHLTTRESVLIDFDDAITSDEASSREAGSSSSTRSAPSLRCLICSSLVYAVARALPPPPTRSLGFFAPGQENSKPASGGSSASPSRPNQSSNASQDSILRPTDQIVWLLPGCSLHSEEAIAEAKKSEDYSEAFGVVMKDSGGIGAEIEGDNFTLPSAVMGSSTGDKTEVRSPSSRPGFVSQRKSSFGPLHMSSSTGLPPLPSSLFSNSSILSSPPRSPSVGSSHKSALFSPTLQASSNSASSASDPLISHLDSAGIDSLRKRRNDAENEIAAFIASKRKELEGYERRARDEGQKLMALGQAAQKTSKKSPGTSTYKIRNQSPKAASSQAPSSKPQPEINSIPISSSPPEPADSQQEPDHSLLSSTLPSSAFERRPPMSPSRYSQSITTPPDPLSSAASSASGDETHFKPSSTSITSQSLSALSASFAMRGRDPPKELEAWANKRRLMERYPEGDHSALNSAEPSGDERSEEDDGEEESGRGRGRGRDRNAINAAKEKQLAMERERERLAYAQGEERSLPMTVGSQVRGGIPSAPGAQYVQSQQSRSSNSAITRANQVQGETEQEVGTPKTSQGSSSTSSSSQAANLNRGRTKRMGSSSPLRSADAEDAESINSGSTAGEAAPVAAVSTSAAPFAPGSLSALSKAPALTRVDTGPSVDDSEAPRAGGILSAHPSDTPTPSADVTLRPRPRPDNSSDNSKLKPAVKGTTTESSSSSTSTTKKIKKGKPKAKKVAFAETTEKVDGATLLPEEESEEEEEDDEAEQSNNLVNESESAVFDIDEEVDRSEAGDSEEDESSPGHQALSDLASDPASRGRSSRTEDSGDEASSTSSDEDKDLEVAASMASVGSLSALASQQSSRKAQTSSFAGDFDPASLRLDGRVVDAGSSIAQRQGSSSSGLPAIGAIPLSEGSGTSRMTHGPSGSRIPMAIGEAEARLSGLLAPQAPSHRGLWSKSGAQAKKKNKYQLGAEDDEKWEAWQSRVRAQEAKAAEGAQSSPLSSSLGGMAAIPTIIRSNGPGFNRSSTIVQDGSSGFDREPKTSLPYNEKLLVPSLRKAIRYSATPKISVPTVLETIQDEREEKIGTSHEKIAVPPNPTETGRGALPGSVTTRGFATEKSSPQILSSDTFAVPSPGAAQSATPLLANKAGGRRSPRPPYVAPPPPTSSKIVLEPNAANTPKPLELFSVPVDTSFRENEDGEEEEEDWEKVVLFMHRLQRLKINKRTGWLHHRIKEPESISDHMYRMAVLAMLCPSTDVDIGKCVQLALIHDLAEAEVGDLTPLDKVPKAEKVKREKEAIEYFVHDLLGDSPAGKRILDLWMEYEERETKESKLVKDLDRFELCLQALEYERSDIITDLQPFWRTSIGHISHPRQRKWAVQLALERQQLWKSRGVEYEQVIKPEDSIASTKTQL